MFLPKQLDKFTNYNYYVVYGISGTSKKNVHEVDILRICNTIKLLRETYKKPYIRFMAANNCDTAMCVVYDGNNRVTKLESFNDVEQKVKSKSL